MHPFDMVMHPFCLPVSDFDMAIKDHSVTHNVTLAADADSV